MIFGHLWSGSCSNLCLFDCHRTKADQNCLSQGAEGGLDEMWDRAVVLGVVCFCLLILRVCSLNITTKFSVFWLCGTSSFEFRRVYDVYRELLTPEVFGIAGRLVHFLLEGSCQQSSSAAAHLAFGSWSGVIFKRQLYALAKFLGILICNISIHFYRIVIILYTLYNILDSNPQFVSICIHFFEQL